MVDAADSDQHSSAAVTHGHNPRHHVGGSVFIVAAAVVVLLLGWRLSGLPMFDSDGRRDALSPQDRRVRVESFLAATVLELQPVRDAQRARALKSLTDPSVIRPSISTSSVPAQLAWLSLWDTNDEDGDVVRVDSEGYSRLVRLHRQAQTFAVPVPETRILNVTGVRDGGGGGITVGVGSGAHRVILPVISPGQVIGVHVGR